LKQPNQGQSDPEQAGSGPKNPKILHPQPHHTNKTYQTPVKSSLFPKKHTDLTLKFTETTTSKTFKQQTTKLDMFHKR
jgi:hypothetical protein